MENPKQQAIARLKQAKNVLVTVSVNPSVDQLAAAIGFTLLLNKLEKHATAVFSGTIPSALQFLRPEATLEKTTDSLRDFIIALDKSKADKLRYKVEDNHVKVFITPYRTSITEKDLQFSQGDFNVDTVVALGVHQQKDLDRAITAHGRILHDATVISLTTDTKSDLGVIDWVNPGASSLSEMLVSLSEELQPSSLDNQMATAFLTGIVAETDRFSNQKTTSETMSVSAKLMAAGADPHLVASELQKESNVPPASAAPVSKDGTLEVGHVDAPESEVNESAAAPTVQFDEPSNAQDDTTDTFMLPDLQTGNISFNQPHVPVTKPLDERRRFLSTDQKPTMAASFAPGDGNNDTQDYDPNIDVLAPATPQGTLLSHDAPAASEDDNGTGSDEVSLPSVGGLEPIAQQDTVTVPESEASAKSAPAVATDDYVALPSEPVDPIAPSETPVNDVPQQPALPDPYAASPQVGVPVAAGPAAPFAPPAPQDTLADLERAVASQYADEQQPVAESTGTQAVDVTQARDAVLDAINQAQPTTLPPIAALNAQPLDAAPLTPEPQPSLADAPSVQQVPLAPPQAAAPLQPHVPDLSVPPGLLPDEDHFAPPQPTPLVIDPTAPPPVPPPMLPPTPPVPGASQNPQNPFNLPPA